LKGVSKHFPARGDWDAQNTFLYVSPNSSNKEKMLQIRSNLIANQ